MKPRNRTISLAFSLLLIGALFHSAAAEEPTKEQRIAEFAKMTVAERQKPEFFAMKLVAKYSAERVDTESDRSKIKLEENEEIIVLNHMTNGKPSKELLIVEKNSRLNRTHILECGTFRGQRGWDLFIKFTEDGKKLLAETTTEADGRRIAIILGGSLVLTAPRMVEPISSGSVMISGNLTQSEAEAVAALFENPKPTTAK